MTAKRRRPSLGDQVIILRRQAICGCGCGQRLDPSPIEYHHMHELALDGPDTPANLTALRKECHARITNGTKATTAGSSKSKIAKANRLEKARLALAGNLPDPPPAAITDKFKTVVATMTSYDAEADRVVTRAVTADEFFLIPKRRGYRLDRPSKQPKGGKKR